MSFLPAENSHLLLNSSTDLDLQQDPKQKTYSLAEAIDYVLYHPQRMPEVMQALFSGEETEDILALFINELKKKSDDKQVLQECFRACLNEVKKPCILQELFQWYPLEFGCLLVMQEPQKGAELLQSMIEQSGNWKVNLADVLVEIEQSDEAVFCMVYSGVDQGYRALLSYLTPPQEKVFIKTCVDKLSISCLVHLLMALDNSRIQLTLNYFRRRHPSEQFEEGFKPLIENLSQFPFCEKVSFILDEILQSYYLKERQELLLAKLDKLNPQGSFYLLAAMSTSKQKDVFFHYRSKPLLLANWFHALSLLKSTFEERKMLFETLYSEVEEERKESFLKRLEKNNCAILPFLLVCNSMEDAEHFVLFENSELRTKLLSYYSFDHTAKKLVETFNDNDVFKQFLYENMTIDLTTSLLETDEMTLKSAYDNFESISNLEEMDITPYLTFIGKMPPILIGVVCSYPNYQAVFLKLVRYLSDQQLPFLMLSIPAEQTFSCIEALLPKIRRNQLRVILKALSPEQLSDYMDKKTASLQAHYQNFSSQLSYLLDQLEQVKAHEVLTPHLHKQYWERAISLLGLLREGTSPFVYDMLWMIGELRGPCLVSKETIENLKFLVHSFESKKPICEGPQSFIFQRLWKLEATLSSSCQEEGMEDATDIFSHIYTEFWSSLTEGKLVHLNIGPQSPLGITHAGQLNLVGICSNQDLGYLRISRERQIFLDQMVLKINALQEGEESTQLQLSQCWNCLFDISTPLDQIQLKIDQILELLAPSHRDLNQLQLVCQNLCLDLLQLDHWNKAQRKKIAEASEHLQSNEQEKSQRLFCQKILSNGIQVIRRWQTCICLQHYLTQELGTKLRDAWIFFQQEGYHSIHDLFKHGILSSRKSLLKLGSVAQKIISSKNELAADGSK